MHFRPAVAFCVFALTVTACTKANVDWPVYQGSDEKTHYTTLSQISPANVSTLKVAWTYDTKDAFEGSEMQSNPVIIDGVLYAMSPKQRAFALDASTGKELWSFDPTGGKFTGPRIRYRGGEDMALSDRNHVIITRVEHERRRLYLIE